MWATFNRVTSKSDIENSDVFLWRQNELAIRLFNCFYVLGLTIAESYKIHLRDIFLMIGDSWEWEFPFEDGEEIETFEVG